MKPTLQQTQNLRSYLRNTLSYRETYEEVYDHILTAIENNPHAGSFEVAVNAVIRSDFGGIKGLLKIEREHCKAVVKDVIKQQWLQFIINFKFPELVWSLLLYAVIYLAVSVYSVQSIIVFILLIVLSVVPGVFVLTRYFRIDYALKDTKKSIKDEILGQVASKPLLLCNPGIFLLIGKSQASLWISSHPITVSLIVTLVALYVFAFIKLCRRDIKSYSLI